MRVRSFVCKASNEITMNVSQIAGWTFTPQGWRVPKHQGYTITLRYFRETGSMLMISTSTLRRTYGRSTSGSLSRLWLHIVQVNWYSIDRWTRRGLPDSSYGHRLSIVTCHSFALSVTCHLTFITRGLRVCLVYLATLSTLFYDMLFFSSSKAWIRILVSFHRAQEIDNRVREFATYCTIKFQQSENNCFRSISSEMELYYFSIFINNKRDCFINFLSSLNRNL